MYHVYTGLTERVRKNAFFDDIRRRVTTIWNDRNAIHCSPKY
jgi:hypothetical protein